MKLTTTLLLSTLLFVVLFLLWITSTPSPTPIADDESQSLYIDPDEWRQRPPTSKIKETLVRPLSSQL
ncbi:MAG: hypothetical protein IJR26_08525 [Bacteroidales bacterium]|nr:hypothetical protein [Bacteroidales bacterium]